MHAAQSVKALLRKLLSEQQYHWLASVRANYPPAKFPQYALGTLIDHKLIGNESLLSLKGKINLREKMDYERHPIFLTVDSQVEYGTRLHSCKKEADTVEWVETFFRDGDVFYDVGANVGAYSLVAAKAHGGRVKVFSFEPAFLNFSQLCKNVHLNDVQGIVTPLSVALSDRTMLGEFNFHDLEPGGAMHTFGEAVDHRGVSFEPVLRQPVLGYRIDDLIEQFGLPVPNHIKIDVDGIELAVLEGAVRTLSSGAVRSLVVELESGDHEKKTSDWLAQYGFRLHSRHERWTPGMLNCIFERVVD
jgi:FkbM family methyltransferase